MLEKYEAIGASLVSRPNYKCWIVVQMETKSLDGNMIIVSVAHYPFVLPVVEVLHLVQVMCIYYVSEFFQNTLDCRLHFPVV